MISNCIIQIELFFTPPRREQERLSRRRYRNKIQEHVEICNRRVAVRVAGSPQSRWSLLVVKFRYFDLLWTHDRSRPCTRKYTNGKLMTWKQSRTEEQRRGEYKREETGIKENRGGTTEQSEGRERNTLMTSLWPDGRAEVMTGRGWKKRGEMRRVEQRRVKKERRRVE